MSTIDFNLAGDQGIRLRASRFATKIEANLQSTTV